MNNKTTGKYASTANQQRVSIEMKKTMFVVALITMFTHVAGFAQQQQRPDSYNYQRGVELISNAQLEDGIAFLEKEIVQNPHNGYAYAWMASALAQQNERGAAINAVNRAIKYLPSKDKYYIAWSYDLKGRIYLHTKDTVKALEAFTHAIKTQPDNDEWYLNRGQVYYAQKQWKKSEADFLSIINLSPGNHYGYVMLALNYFSQEKYEEALQKYQVAHQLAERSYIFSGMAQIEIKLKKYEAAATHIIDALTLEVGEESAIDIMLECKDEEFVDLLLKKMHVQTLKSPNDMNWYFYQTLLMQEHKDYENAIQMCKKVCSINPDPFLVNFQSILYMEMGDLNNALRCINEAIAADSTELVYRHRRALIYYEMDSVNLMNKDFDFLMEAQPDNEVYYFSRAQINFYNQLYKQAIEDYDMGLAINPHDYWERYMRGRCYQAIGENEYAQNDFLYVENNAKEVETLLFAKMSLGKKQEALTIADSLLAKDTLKHTYRYNLVCIYAVLGEKEVALREIENELRDGNVNFKHMRKDPDLKSIREELEILIQHYEEKAKERVRLFNLGRGEKSIKEQRIVEIPFSVSNGVTKVDCTINGLPLNFIFDTGASEVTLSLVEANFMLKNNYIVHKDIMGQQYYQTADGSINVGTVVNLRKINFGGLELHNVRASVVASQDAPLLLGQSILQRLGKIEIDNEKRILKILNSATL